MSAPITKVDICNLMMDHLGQTANITNIDTPETEEEIKCARWYDTVRRALLRSHPWGFAKARFQCSRDSVTPPFGYSDAYNLPNDYIRLNSINDTYYNLDYMIEGKQILLNNSGAASINISYTKDVTDISKFDPLFVDLFAVEGAWRMAFAFTLKPSLKQQLKETLSDLRVEAKAVNSQERPPKRIQYSKFLAARRGQSSNVAGKNTYF